MRVLLKLMYKDLLVIIRDRAGLAMLFIMPLALVLIMTSLQDNTFRAINESGINLILLNNDRDSLGNALEREITGSHFFVIHHGSDTRSLDEQEVREGVASGKYQIGVIIPSGTTQKIRKQVADNVDQVFSGDTLAPSLQDSVKITIFLDPTTKNTMRSSLQGMVREYTGKVESRIMLQELNREVNRYMKVDLGRMKQETIAYHEQYVARGDRTVIPNAVQHNVPAWTLFGMFFIVIPFASAMIKEREDGSLHRLLTMPCSYFQIMFSKVLIYLLVCYTQFVSIVLMGTYVFPLVGLNALSIDGQLGILAIMALVAAFAAVSYGVSVGTIARTHQQAAIFGSISVVILAALGGIWVPVFIMPPFFRSLSRVSPLNWGLNGFYDILLRHAHFTDVLPDIIRIILFSLCCLIVTLYFQKIRRTVG